ncbi:MAG: PDZ domain-containing protein [Gammaproteobacteria bacterium]|jgi:hypothetical protein
MNVWFASTGSFVAGLALGALALAAVEIETQRAETPPSQVAGLAKAPHPGISPGDVERGESANAGGAQPVSLDAEERWARVTEVLAALSERVSALEGRLAALEPGSPVETTDGSRGSDTGGMDQQTLVAAGVDPGRAAEIMRSQSRLEMQRLELRDQASREGWLGSDRFFEEMRKLGGDIGALREQIGDDAYDRFLYLTGQPNRVVVASVIDGSPAQLAGIEAGDVVLDYAESRVFGYLDLRDATRAGQLGEYVLVRVQRGQDTLALSVLRGPLGVRLDADQVDPDPERSTLIQE